MAKFWVRIRLEETILRIICIRPTEQPNSGGGERELAGSPEASLAHGGAWGSFWR